MRKTRQTSCRSGPALAGLLVLAACGNKGLPYNLPGFIFARCIKRLRQVYWWIWTTWHGRNACKDPVLNRQVACGLCDGITLEIARERAIAEALRLAVPGAVTLSPHIGHPGRNRQHLASQNGNRTVRILLDP